jgi:polyphenol oxidase
VTALPAPFAWGGDHVTAELPGGRVLFSTRRGGVSTGPYASLNLGRLTDDDGANVDANRERLADAVGLPRGRFLYGRQVHGARVRRGSEPHGPERPAEAEDGQATALRDAAALVFVADCLPVLLAADGAVAAVHCGWRGVTAGIVTAGVAAVRELAGEHDVSAVIGPAIGPCCYEVGDEVIERFAARGHRLAGPALDLPAAVASELEWCGISDVSVAHVCVSCNPELFYSHRRDGGVTGRQAGLAWLKS